MRPARGLLLFQHSEEKNLIGGQAAHQRRGAKDCGEYRQAARAGSQVLNYLCPLIPSSLLDRGWGRAAQLVDVQGEVRQLVEVKLSVVAPAVASMLPDNEPLTIEHNEIKDLESERKGLLVSSEPGEK